jgi:hypothetical protein
VHEHQTECEDPFERGVESLNFYDNFLKEQIKTRYICIRKRITMKRISFEVQRRKYQERFSKFIIFKGL